MEYVWFTLLHRVDFEECTPLEWFSQFEIYKKINNIDQENNSSNSKKEEVKETYIDFLT
ncbi:hypothetical protein GNF80_10005 [Clostridium perfringens]|nr:hypothetical protein [Clostridium perfringens]